MKRKYALPNPDEILKKIRREQAGEKALRLLARGIACGIFIDAPIFESDVKELLKELLP